MIDQLPFIETIPKFCPRDGMPLGDELKAGKLRRVCPSCGYIYGRDPRVVLGLAIEQAGEWLFLRRGGAGRKVWSLPLYPCRERQDPRVMAVEGLESETRLKCEAGQALDAFQADSEELGPVLVLMFRGSLPRNWVVDREGLRFASPAAIAAGVCEHLTSKIVKRLG